MAESEGKEGKGGNKEAKEEEEEFTEEEEGEHFEERWKASGKGEAGTMEAHGAAMRKRLVEATRMEAKVNQREDGSWSTLHQSSQATSHQGRIYNASSRYE